MSKNPQTPRILLISGIFYPDVGGPAIHVRKIAEHLHSLNWHVTVLTFGDSKHNEPYRVVRVSRRHPKLISWLLYALLIFFHSISHKLIYAFDLTTAGLPAAITSRILRKPLLLRIGGDPIWERVVEKGQRFIPMGEYYEQNFYTIDRPLLYRLIRFVVRSAVHVVVYNHIFKNFYIKYFGLFESRTSVVPNPMPLQKFSKDEQGTCTFIFAGRFVSYKNLTRVIRVFSRLLREHSHIRLIFVGEGPEEKALRFQVEEQHLPVVFRPKMNQQELHALLADSSVALAPALTEFNPNFILEALSLGKPVIISRGNGLSVELPEYMTFDPLDDESLYVAMKNMIDANTYTDARAYVRAITVSNTWDDVVRRHQELIQLHVA